MLPLNVEIKWIYRKCPHTALDSLMLELLYNQSLEQVLP